MDSIKSSKRNQEVPGDIRQSARQLDSAISFTQSSEKQTIKPNVSLWSDSNKIAQQKTVESSCAVSN